MHMMLCVYIEYIITFLNNNLGVACQNVSPVVDLFQSKVMQLLLLPSNGWIFHDCGDVQVSEPYSDS